MDGKAPNEIARFLTTHGYHPRSSAHGDAMCTFLLKDLYDNCIAFKEMADKGKIVYQTNFTVNKDTPYEWEIDLVIGPTMTAAIVAPYSITKGDPESVRLAIDSKAIMTEHGKARRNRQRDLNSMADILHRIHPEPVIGAHVLINMSERFRSPLRRGITTHRNIGRVVAGTLPLLNEILADSSTRRPGLDAIGVTVIDYSNLKGATCKLVQSPPAPDPTSPLHYQNFLQKICKEFTNRFAEEQKSAEKAA